MLACMVVEGAFVRTVQGWGRVREGRVVALRHTLAEILSGAPVSTTDETLPDTHLAPVDEQEVWAAGVTYQRSLEARREESHEPDVYERVYEADRPELFFKSTADRVVGPGGDAAVRADSTWDVPEPEVALVIDASGSLFGYTICDDVSSRSIEGDNPLYLPQAKVYEGACVLGPCIVPASDAQPPFDLTMTIERGGSVAFEGASSTSRMRRSFDELISWLFRGLRFPSGVILSTGTDLVPGEGFTLREGDRVRIEVSGIGVLEHGVRTLG